MSGRYTARAAVAAECDGAGRTRVTGLRSDGPLAVREARQPHQARQARQAHQTRGRETATVYLVGAAAGPLGGDDLTLHLTVAPGACLAVRSAATTLALPGDGESRLTIRAWVGAGGRLDFAPEPTVAVAGCHHSSVADIELGTGATLRWRDELILGRHREEPGRYASRCEVTLDGLPLLRHELRLDGAGTYTSRAVLAGATAAGTVILAGPGLIDERAGEAYADDDLAVLPLAGPGVLVSATAADAVALRRRLERGTELAAGRHREPTARAAP